MGFKLRFVGFGFCLFKSHWPSLRSLSAFCSHAKSSRISKFKEESLNQKLQIRKQLEELREKHGYGDRKFEELTLDKYKDLLWDESSRTKVELILSEYEYLKYTTQRVPSDISVDDMKRLLGEATERDRHNIIDYLYIRENARIDRRVMKIEHSQHYWASKKVQFATSLKRSGIFDIDGNINYGLWHNSVVSKISPTAIKKVKSLKLRTSAQFGQKLVVDLGYDQYMNSRECRLMLKHLAALFGFNKYYATQPFDLHFCNAQLDQPTMQNLNKFILNYHNPQSFLSIHTQSYVDLFAKDRLVYLSPNAKEPLLKYNFDDIYIIGGYYDYTKQKPRSLIKAQQERVRVARLPINEHLVWGTGNKSLYIHQVAAILHHWAVGGDWHSALKTHVPEKMLKDEDEIAHQDSERMRKFEQHLERQRKEKSEGRRKYNQQIYNRLDRVLINS